MEEFLLAAIPWVFIVAWFIVVAIASVLLSYLSDLYDRYKKKL